VGIILLPMILGWLIVAICSVLAIMHRVHLMPLMPETILLPLAAILLALLYTHLVARRYRGWKKAYQLEIPMRFLANPVGIAISVLAFAAFLIARHFLSSDLVPAACAVVLAGISTGSLRGFLISGKIAEKYGMTLTV